ncbi:hypothetical protein D8M21_07110 [Kocuria sp. HSID16901]|nr:hypothetical protein D8M21_07110 [Kocuria sp. HSID16901]
MVANGANSNHDSNSGGNSQSSSSDGSGKSDDTPADYKAALKKGQSYAQTMNMSKQGIYNQLTSSVEQFTPEAAQYAIDHIDANWNENALKKAKDYQSQQNMSPEAVRTQLTSEIEGFTPEEADYAIQHLNG